MELLLWIVVMTLAAVAFVEIVRRLPPVVGLVTFLLVAPVTLWGASRSGHPVELFNVVKLCSAAAGAAYIQALKLTRWVERPLGRGVAWVILAANVLEAVVAEGAQGRLVDAINATAGVLLILSQPSPGSMRVAPRAAGGDFRYPLGLWVAAYTLWNFTFLYGRASPGGIGSSAGFGVIHLGAPLLAMRGDSELWIQARGFALTVLVAVHVGLPHPPFDYLSLGWYTPSVALALRVVSLALAALVAGRALSRALTS